MAMRDVRRRPKSPFTWKRFAHLLACAGRCWVNDNTSTMGAALAFFSAFSLAPLLVILLTIAGGVFGEHAAYGQVQAQLQGLFGPATTKTIMGAVQASKQTKGLISTIVSIITLLIGASSALIAL